MSKCPGQDTRFWTPEDVTETACGRCGTAVEFFKTDGVRRCPHCGARIVNPKVAMGCAQWCAHAQECLGFDPKSVGIAQAEGNSIADRLIDRMKAEFGDDQKRIAHALRVLERSEQLLGEDGGQPNVVVAAALLHDIGIHAAERKHGSPAAKYQEIEGPAIARRILEEVGFGEDDIEHVCKIVGSHHSGGLIDTREFRIVWDADVLVNWLDERRRPSEGEMNERLRTPGGLAAARAVFGATQEGIEKEEP